MIIRVPKKPNDDNSSTGHDHDAPHLSRRDFIARGIYTGVLSVAIPKIFAGGIIKDAMATVGNSACPTAVRTPGCIAQMFLEGGYGAGSYVLSDQMVTVASSSQNAADRYGVERTFMKLGPNFNVSTNSLFAKRIIANGARMGFTPQAWLQALGKISVGYNCGPMNQDDGGGSNTGLIAGVSSIKSSALGTDVMMGVNNKLASFAVGMPATKVGETPNPQNMVDAFSMLPAAKTNKQTVTNSANAAKKIGQALAGIFGLEGRTGGEEAFTAASCGFFGNATLADPTYAPALFNPANVNELRAMAAGVTDIERALMASYFQSAKGTIGGVFSEFGGFDYHGKTPAEIGVQVLQFADAFTAWVAACNASATNGALIVTSNGQAVSKGFTANVAVGGTTGNVHNANNDAGGAFNNSMLFMFNGVNAAVAGKTLGALNSTTGDAKPAMGSQLAMQGLYASALIHVTGTLTNAANIRLGSPSPTARVI